MNNFLIKSSAFLVLILVSIIAVTSYSVGFQHLLKLGMYSQLYLDAGMSFIMIFVVASVCFMFNFIRSYRTSNEFKKSNDEYLLSIIDKD
jgi:hypothetical protein